MLEPPIGIYVVGCSRLDSLASSHNKLNVYRLRPSAPSMMSSQPGPQTRGSRSQSVKENRPALQPVLEHSASSASTATNTTNISRSNAISGHKTPGASRDDVSHDIPLFAYTPIQDYSIRRGSATRRGYATKHL